MRIILPPDARILLVRLSALGDTVLTLPVLDVLRHHFPKATIGWLVESEAASIVQGHPLLDHVHISQRKRWLANAANPIQWKNTFTEVHSFLSDIRDVRYDVAIDVQGLFKSAMLPFLLGIPNRIGYANTREQPSQFYTHTVPLLDELDPEIPVIEHFLQLTTVLGCDPQAKSWQYTLPDLLAHEQDHLEAVLHALPADRPIVAMAPKTKWESKHWLESHWKTLIESVLTDTSASIVLVGGPSDKLFLESLIPKGKAAKRVLNLAGQVSLRELQGLFELVQVVVGLDSAPLHLAGAVNRAKIIGIYGPTGYRRTSPPYADKAVLLSTENELSCQPCHKKTCHLGTHECMTRITPAQVLNEVVNALAIQKIGPQR